MKKLLFILLTVLLMLPAAMRAQNVVEIGTGTSTDSKPFYGLYANSWCEMIYPASEFESSGTITQLDWNCSTESQHTYSTVKIYLGTKSSDVYSSTSDWTPMSALTLVYDHTNVTVGAATGWQSFILDTPFEYDADENLVIVVAKTMPSWASTYFYYTSVSNTCLYRGNDSDGSYGTTHPGSSTGTLGSVRSNVKVSITYSSGCTKPSNLVASNVDDQSATLSWMAGGTESSWDIYYTTDATDVPDETTEPMTTLTDMSYQLSGLESSTTYYFYVRSNCEDGEMSRWKSVSFTTFQTLAELPYTQDFEDATENANWTIVNGTYTNKWYIDNQITEDESYCMYVSKDTGRTNTYNITSSSYVWAYRDIDFGTYAGYNLAFDWRDSTELNWDYIEVYVGPALDPSTFGTTVPSTLEKLGRFNTSVEWTRDTIVLTSLYGGVQRLYFYWKNDASGGTGQAGAVDNIYIEGLDCGPVLSGSVGEITDNSIEFSFVPAVESDNSWDVVCMPHDSTLDESLAFPIYDTNYVISGLEPNTAYDIYIRTSCGSPWGMFSNVRTECAQVTIPYTDNFDDASGSSVMPWCWSKFTTYSTYPYTSTTNFSAPYSLYFYATSGNYNIAVMPDMEDSYNVQDLSVSFMMRAGNVNYKLYVGVMDSLSANGFVALDSVQVTTANEWEEFEVALTDYMGEGHQVAFKVYGHGQTENLYIDNVSLYNTPTCLKPFDLTVSNVTSNSATIDWNPRGDETSWAVVAVEHGQDPEAGTAETADTHPYTLNGLTDNTHYDVYVKALCGGGDESVWSTSIDFHTKCLPTDVLPYTEGFEGLGGSGQAYFPACWTRHTNYTTTNYPYVSTSYHSEGTSSLYFYNPASTNWCYAATQGLDLSQYEAGSLLLNFKLQTTSSSYGRMDIGITTDADDISSMTILKSIYPGDMSSTYTWYDYSVALPAQYEDVVYLVFSSPAGVEYNTMYLDEISLVAPTCTSPSNLTVSNIAGSSAMVSWNAAPVAVESYVVEYTEAGQENWVSSTVSETSVILTGLTEQTRYDVRVFSNCDEGETDTLTANFKTKCLVGGEVAVGNGTTGNYYIPVNNYYHYTYSQQLFLASELNGPTDITSVSFEYGYSLPTTKKTNCTIYLGHTDQSSFTGSSNYIPLSALHQVYHGNLNCTQGWNTFTFDSVFQYDGVSNLVLVVDDNSDQFDGQSYVFKVHTAPFTSSLYFYSDSNHPDPADPTAVSANVATSANRNNVIFGGECGTATCVAPNVYDITVDAESITLQWIPGLDETSWEVRYQEEGETDWTVATVTESPYTIENLNASTNYNVGMRSDCGGDYSDWTNSQIYTPCADITLPYTQDFESATGSGDACFIDCWSRGTNYSYTNYPYVTTQSSAPIGSKTLYFYGSSSYYSYAATNQFADDILMDSLLISFNAYKTTASYNIEVGIMTDPTNKSTFVPIATVTPSTTSTWENLEVRTSAYSGEGRYVAFRAPQGAANYMYIDDINIIYIPSCSHVEDIALTDVTTNSATIGWTAVGGESNWAYVYGQVGTIDIESIEESDWIPTSENPITIEGLEPNTAYEIYVKSYCDNGEESTPVYFTFRTNCVAITADVLPYIEDFDNYGTSSSAALTSAYPYCWSRISSSTTEGRPYCSSSYKYNGVASLYFYTSSSSAYEYAIAPELAEDLDITTLQAKFMGRTSSTTYTGRIIVGVMSDPTNIQTFVPVDTFNANGSSTWTEKVVSFENYTGTGKYIALKHNYSSSDYVYIDHFVLDVIPACAAPEDVAISGVTSSSAELTWNSEEGESEWQVGFCLMGQTPDYTLAETVNSNSYTFNNLEDNSAYTAYVRTVCANGAGYSEWVMVNFMTSSANPATTPYFHDFEDDEENAEWTLLNANVTNKWHIGQPQEENDNVLFVSKNDTTETYDKASVSNVWAYRDIQFGDAAEFNLSFSWKAGGESTYDYLKVYIGLPALIEAGTNNCQSTATTNDPEGAQVIGVYNLKSTWQNAQATLSGQYANSVQRLYFRWNNDGSGGVDPAVVLDSIQITSTNCGAPYNITADNITSTSFDVTFQPAMSTDNAWEYVCCLAGADPELETPTQITGTPAFSVTGLTAATYYDVYVRTVCDGGETSGWNMTTVVTDCDIFNLNYEQDFDSYTTGVSTGTSAPAGFPNVTMPVCWSFLNNSSSSSSYPQMFLTSSSTYAVSGNCLFFKSSSTTPAYAILPELNEALQNMQISFTYRNESTGSSNGTLYLGYMTDPSDASTFVSVYTCPQTTTKTNVEFNFNNVPAEVTTAYIAFRYSGGTSNNYYASIDNVFVGLIPTCVKPTNPTASYATDHTVTLAWTENGNATDWNIEYGPAGFTQGQGTTVQAPTNPFTLTGLDALTSYDFYVQANCGGGDLSYWSVKGTFATFCEAFDMPFVEDFNSISSGIPTCWDNSEGTTTTESYKWNYYSTGYEGAGLRFNSYINSNGNTNTLKTPVINVVSDASLSFYYKNPTGGDFSVYVIANGTQTLLEGGLTGMSDWTRQSYDLSEYAGQGVQIAFIGTSNYGPTGAYIDLDSVAVLAATTPVEPCDAPTNLQIASITTNSAVASWNAGGSETSWKVGYKLQSAGQWQEATVSTTTYSIEGLTANSTYDFRVKAVCSADNQSDFVTTSFTTNPEVGIDNVELSNSISLMPNPADNYIEMTVNGNVNVKEAAIYNAFGQMIQMVQLTDNHARINLDNYASGMYFVRVAGDNAVATKKFIKK